MHLCWFVILLERPYSTVVLLYNQLGQNSCIWLVLCFFNLARIKVKVKVTRIWTQDIKWMYLTNSVKHFVWHRYSTTFIIIIIYVHFMLPWDAWFNRNWQARGLLNSAICFRTVSTIWFLNFIPTTLQRVVNASYMHQHW